MNKKILIVTNSFPREGDLYRNGFVYTRVKEYISRGQYVNVFVYDKKNKPNQYEINNIKVNVGNKESLIYILKKGDYNNIIIHFAYKEYTKIVYKYKKEDQNVIIWVHGVEALSWKRRLFYFKYNLKGIFSFIRYIYRNVIQLRFLRKIILKSNNLNTTFVFVSEWMKKITETDTKSEVAKDSYFIIPNPVNTNIFKHKIKSDNDRFKIFNIRPYTSKKYANDITRDIILKLSKKDYFEQLEFNLFGDGPDFEKITKKIRKYSNVKIRKTFLTQEEIACEHSKNGVLLMPTRQDAQGVSMCEAISSGLVPIVSNNTAIPEFVDSSFGYLCDDVDSFITSIEDIFYNPKKYIEMQSNTIKICEILSMERIFKEEIEIINK